MSAPDSNSSPNKNPVNSSDGHHHITTAAAPELIRGATRDALFPGAIVARRFALKRLIGKGGMGVVWEVHDKTLGRDVALKFLGAEIASDQEAVTDLQRETRRSLELTHPNIVRIYDYVEDTDFQLVGISMELLTGQSLQAFKLQQTKWVFTTEQVRPWLRQICAALDYAHQTAGVVHRDLKPGNIFIDERGTLKIVDFGVAMVVRESTSHVLQEARLSRSGTLTYMSPQQLRGDKPTSADDWYSVGALLYELFTGKPPFFRGDPHALMHQVMTHQPLPIAQRQAEMGVTDIQVPANWEQAILACLSKDAAARPKSGVALLTLLEGGALPIEKAILPTTSAIPFLPLDADKTLMQVPPFSKPKREFTHPLLCRAPIKKNSSLDEYAHPSSRFGATTSGRLRPVAKHNRWPFITFLLAALVVASGLLFYLRYTPKPELPVASPVLPGLTLRVDPLDAHAQVQIDDQLPMVVPPSGRLLIRDLADGDHIISAQAAGFEPFKARTVLRNSRGEFEVGLVALRGSLEVNGRAGSRVILRQADDSEIVLGQIGPSGKTVFSDRVHLGETAIRLEHPDCLPTDFRRINVTGGQTSRVRVDQKLLPALLSVATEPAGAEIFIDGQSKGREPVELNDVKANTEIEIEARLEGYETTRQRYTFKPREHRELAYRLQQLKGDIIVSARPGTRVFASQPGQPKIELGSVSTSGEAKFSQLLAQGHWTVVLENPECQPTPGTDISVSREQPVLVSAEQIPRPGSLDIRSEPAGVEVWIQGVKQGTTPALIKALPSEIPLTLELRLKGRLPLTRSVTLRPEERSALFFDKFTPEYVYSRIDVQPWEKLRGRRIAYSIDGTPAVPRSSMGSVVEMRFDAGTEHLLKIQAEGFHERSVAINTAEDRVHRVTLEALPSQVSIVSEPARALAWLNGVGPRETPVTFLDLTPGRYILRVEKPGFSSHFQDVMIGTGEAVKIGPVSLIPIPARPAPVIPASSAELVLSSPSAKSPPAAASPPVVTAPPPVVARPPAVASPPIVTAPPAATPPAVVTAPPAEDIPSAAQVAGTLKLSGHTRLDYILNIIRSTAIARGWSVVKSQNNIVVLNMTSHDHDATLYLRCESEAVEFFSDSYRAGVLGRFKQTPTTWLRDLQSDLARQLY